MRAEEQLQRSLCTLQGNTMAIPNEQPIGSHPVKRGDRPPLQSDKANCSTERREAQIIHRHPQKSQPLSDAYGPPRAPKASRAIPLSARPR
ncbi:hypothetical protein MUK42_36306 [Musa troglodytarum]|uniref:Uncharacterized protein n=1 Tax=Musa troglodytarum TaxID=320322 RepID=A0A9E7KI91_9LILI|nr:hypothetical protein MUK42_36306 [Musa troglodytarum]